MAAVGFAGSGGASVGAGAGAGASESNADANLWESILQASARGDRGTDSTVVFVGNRGSGVRSLVRRLQQLAVGRRSVAELGGGGGGDSFRADAESQALAPCAASALRFAVVDKADIYSEHSAAASGRYGRLHLWMLTDITQAGLLKYALAPATLSTTTVVLGLDMSQPWTVTPALEKWTGLVTAAVNEAAAKLPQGSQDALRSAVLNHVRLYKPPGTKGGRATGKPARLLRVVASKPRGDSAGAGAADEAGPQLPEGVLEVNIGVPLVVACCKCDVLSAARRAANPASALSDQQLDFLQTYLRKFCLRHGAALVNVSSVGNTNVEQLYCYLMQRTDAARFVCLAPAELADRETLFIPSGADSAALINDVTVALPESVREATSVHAVIPVPKTESKEAQPGDEDEVVALTEAEFAAEVKKLAAKARRDTDRLSASKVLDRERTATSKSRDRRRVSEPATSARKPGAADDMDAAQLKGFFEGLLSSKGTARSSRRRAPGGSTSRSSRSRKDGAPSGSSSRRRGEHKSSRAAASAAPAPAPAPARSSDNK